MLATGTAARKMFPALDVHPRKGHLLITDRYPGFLHHQLIELRYLKSAHSLQTDSVAFNAQPRKTGQLLIGSSRQYGTEIRRRLGDACEDAPARLGIHAGAAFRFGHSHVDGLPRCDARQTSVDWRVGRGSWRFLATGHEGLGISTSLATAKLLCDLLLGRESLIPREPYSSARSFTHV